MLKLMRIIIDKLKRPRPPATSELTDAQRRLELLELRHNIYDSRHDK